MTVCPLCQRPFAAREACQGCGLIHSCPMVKCPHCGYGFVERSSILSGLRWLIGWFRKKEETEREEVTRPLSEVSIGCYRIVTMALANPPRNPMTLNRLVALGLVPGTEVRVQQTRPSYLLRVGETDLAIDLEVARGIGVTPMTSPASPIRVAGKKEPVTV